jgi:hypothetical protein
MLAPLGLSRSHAAGFVLDAAPLGVTLSVFGSSGQTFMLGDDTGELSILSRYTPNMTTMSYDVAWQTIAPGPWGTSPIRKIIDALNSDGTHTLFVATPDAVYRAP